jgi:hypothetical protein
VEVGGAATAAAAAATACTCFHHFFLLLEIAQRFCFEIRRFFLLFFSRKIQDEDGISVTVSRVSDDVMLMMIRPPRLERISVQEEMRSPTTRMMAD